MVMGSLQQEVELVVIGGGPGGYIAAIRAADLGKEVLLVEAQARLGGVCLLEGCIPSKTLINAVELINAASEAHHIGISFEGLRIDIDTLRAFTESTVQGLSEGIHSLLKQRGVEVIQGYARFRNSSELEITGAEISSVKFEHCIVATGSRINELPGTQELPLWNSAEALKLPEIPERLLVVGGGYIGLEMGLVYAGLGSKVSMVEFSPQLLSGADPDLLKFVIRSCKRRFEELMLNSKVAGIERKGAAYLVRIEHKGEVLKREVDQVLVAVGRRPNTQDIGLENTRIQLNKQGLIEVDERCCTVEPRIFAIGDIVPGPQLAHKASREAKVAAEVIAGRPSAFDNRAVPAVVFTDPEMAWVGLSEAEAKEQSLSVKIGRFPLKASGRARTMGRSDGMVKVLSDPESDLLLGVGMVGPHASELISEACLALEMGATLEDLMVTIHPHPTLAESLLEASEDAAGLPIHLHHPGIGA